ncbi:hypothetical protein TraAM80_06896 [Trypanosoma rangeli]|uniref:Uncharacterized protein n=1 Tax=Trypanosoma rangeli TaxID=5698 RepID=A0A3R7MFT0_TRYRA|nr:uncharacterized protein TraAM80_06896 [Trypanosoma rangeli]RNF01712.1 hypothetical protein TraAM80_06896 [Trypanosoma rangeli]|eukprot:RNF01712.1 hypothetical protein TraAM80_06896 [Trypanosoma rangeli]
MPSPEIKHRRTEEQVPFVLPQFHLPPQPPVNGFPHETDLLIRGVRGRAGVDGKALLLNASPTLELSTDESAALLTALRQHPKCESIRAQLNGINESYLVEVFGEVDAQEDDTRRRVDYNAACAVLKSNSSKRLSACVSCLTRGQHRHYRSWILNYMQTGLPPKATEEYPDMSTVVDLVQREQTAYLHKFMEEIVSCEACKMEAGYNKRSSEAAEMPMPHRSCWNHNYMDEHVERFAKRWWRYRIESRLLRCLADEETSKDNNSDDRGAGNHGDDAFRENVFYLKKGLAGADTRTKVWARPRAELTSQTRQFAAQCIASTNRPNATCEEARHYPAVSIPPTLPLAVQQLDTREPQLYSRAFPEQPRGEIEKGAAGAEEEEMPLLIPPVNTMTGVSFTLRVCKSALVELAAAHLSSCRAEFRLPVRCVWQPSERRVDISIEKPLPGHRESRRNINAAALKRLVDNEVRLPSNSRCSARGRHKSKCWAEVSFGADFAFYCVSNCVFDLTHQYPVFRLIKMEYNCKGYNTVPDDEQTFHHESFSKREVVRMWILLHCNPTAVLYVYRINAYSNAVMGIEKFSSVSFMSQVMGSWSSDVDVQRTWSSLYELLQSTVSAVVQRLQLSGGADGAKNVTFILAKEKEDGNVSLCSVKACYPQQTVLDEAVGTFIEPSSRTVCRREYLPPCVWPFPDRIPYTYGPAPKSCYVINRTTETRHDSAYYAKHDVWQHESRYYTVGEDGVIRELQPACA